MGTSVGVGSSASRNSRSAGREAARGAAASLDGKPADLVLAFATTGHDQSALLAGVREVLGEGRIAGCSAEGVITQEGSVEASHALSVMAVASDELSFDAFWVDGLAEDARALGVALAAAVRARGRPGNLLVLFADGVRGNCGELLDGLESALPFPVTVVGGTAGDLLRFERTYQYHEGGAGSGGVSALLVGGAFESEIIVSHGCELVGEELTVTRATGGLVHEIDGQPAWALFRRYVADDAADLDAMGVSHLLLAEHFAADSGEADGFTVRVPLKRDGASGGLFFAAGLREGTKVQIAVRNPELVSARAADAARALARRRAEKPLFVLQLDCAGRGRLLFGAETTRALVAPAQEALGKDVPWIGLHTYGEIAPAGGRTYFHNYTGVLCILYRTRRPADPAATR